jgi:hypothetical protein
MANGRPGTLPTGHPSAPPWQYSPALGGEFVYKPNTDELVLRDGRHFARPQNIPRTSLVNASWSGPLPFRYSDSLPTDRPSRPPWTNSTAVQYSDSPPTSYPSQPPVIDTPALQYSGSPPTGHPSRTPWTNSPLLGGDFYYNPQTDEIVMKNGRRVPRPPYMTIDALRSSRWVPPDTDLPPGSSDYLLLGGGRERTESTGRSHPRSMDSATQTQMQGLMSRSEPTSAISRGKALEMRTPIKSFGGRDPSLLKVAPDGLSNLFPDFKLRTKGFSK